MMTQTVPPPRPYKFFGPQAIGNAPPGANMMVAQQRLPVPNMYASFNQFKHVNVPPPNMSIPPPTIVDPLNAQQMPAVHQAPFLGQQSLDFDARKQQRKSQRRTVDYNASIVQQVKNRVWRKTSSSVPSIQPDVQYYVDLASPKSIIENPVNAVTTRFVRTATNKIRCPVFSLSWTPEGRRLITGSSSGEFTLWGGLTFNFETVLQAHDSAVRTMEWSHNDTWLLSADHSGYVKYWQSNMNNVKTLPAHTEPVRGVGFSPTDNKFATCSDDGTVKIWDFYRCQEERVLRGHGADVKCLDWHPSKGLLVSGSKDSQQPLKLWDPKSGSSLCTIHMHKSTVMDLQWNRNGDWLLTASRDHLIKVFDIRAMKEIQTFRGHKKEATAVDWHPVHESLFASGGSDGAIMFWNMGSIKEVGSMDHAHDAMIWSVRWHPLGHILASGSNDHTCKFWTRNRPGDKMKDKYNLNTNPLGDDDYEYDIPTANETSDLNVSDLNSSAVEESVPGLAMGAAGSSLAIPVAKAEGIPGIDMQFPSADKVKEQQEAKQKMLQSARQSGFKLPNLQAGSAGNQLNASALPFEPNLSIPPSRQLSSQAARTVSSAPGLLPTPDKLSMIVPPPDTKGIFDPLTIQPGFVIDALEVWTNDKALTEDASHGENRAKKRTRRPEMPGRSRFPSESREYGGKELRQSFDQSQEEYGNENVETDNENRSQNFGWRDGPDDRRMSNHPQGAWMKGPPPNVAEDSGGIRPSAQQFRGRPPTSSEGFPPKEQRMGSTSFHGKGGNPSNESMSNDPQLEEGGQWGKGPEIMNRRDGPGSRGRGRGFPPMHRQGPSGGHGDNNKQFFVDEYGNRKAVEERMEEPWRGRGRGQGLPNNGFEGKNIESEDKDSDWNDPNFIPHRRGPHPLLLRGHHTQGPRRFPTPNTGRPPFDSRGPPIRQGAPQPRMAPHFRPGPAQRQSPNGPPNKDMNDSGHPNELHGLGIRPSSKMGGSLDSKHPVSDVNNWPNNRTGMGR
ncbi:uncharacterized protein LOC135688058 [Rhopilema esculentum]|uniref:uncharacterized protein LOC135688058 n=1 Tax=Rhopilema esculentum TaxID=499914 RepID=UPI0031D47847